MVLRAAARKNNPSRAEAVAGIVDMHGRFEIAMYNISSPRGGRYLAHRAKGGSITEASSRLFMCDTRFHDSLPTWTEFGGSLRNDSWVRSENNRG